MIRSIRATGLTASILLLSVSALGHAQIPGLERAPPAQPPQPASDPLGRTTPRGTIASFIRAVDRNELPSATQYLQVTPGLQQSPESLARDLKTLLDRYQAFTSISDDPAGALNDGLPIDRERVGPLTIGDQVAEINLVRVTDPQAGQVWLVSSETLARVPAWRGLVAQTWMERVMPAPLLRRTFFGIPLAHWVVLAATVAIPLVLLAAISNALVFLVRQFRRDPAKHLAVEVWSRELRWPVVILLTLVIHATAMRTLGFPLSFRIAWARVVLFSAVIAVTWLLRRVLTLGFRRARLLAWGKDNTSTRSLMLLVERMAKAVVVLIAVFAILTIVGVNTRTALAGLGIGGVALALGAQKTVENLLGGFFLLSDKAIAVGDQCSIGGRVGWVEDITLRSVRLRTVDRTLVSVPAGVLAQAGIENFATRGEILVQTTLALRYGTSVEQLRRILAGIRHLLDENEKIEKGSSRIRLVNFGDQAVELELFAYVLTPDLLEFLAVREELLLDVASIVESSGTAFAQPKEVIVMDRKPAKPETADVAVLAGVARESPQPRAPQGEAEVPRRTP